MEQLVLTKEQFMMGEDLPEGIWDYLDEGIKSLGDDPDPRELYKLFKEGFKNKEINLVVPELEENKTKEVVMEIVRHHKVEREGKSPIVFMDIKSGEVKFNGLRGIKSKSGKVYVFEPATTVTKGTRVFENKFYELSNELKEAVIEVAAKLLG